MLKKTAILVLFSGFMCWPLNMHADDIDIFSGSLINVAPNVLIIFDTSGSMSDNVPASVYDPSYDYARDVDTGWGRSARSRYMVYRKTGGDWGAENWSPFATTTADIACGEAKDALDTIGHWVGYIQSGSPHGCGSRNTESLATGNYLNYLASPSTHYSTKLAVAQDVVKKLLDTTATVRFGLMRFNDEASGDYRGGRILSLVGTNIATIKTQIDGLTARGATPLAESLAEAGLYFAGKASWANPGTSYVSPIQWRCQKNYVIVMTDGNSWSDIGNGNGDNIFSRDNYMDNRKIGDRDADGADPGMDSNGGTHWLDDVAKFLYEEDLILTGTDQGGGSFNDANFSHQRIVTYTIGFATGSNDLLLKRAADSSHGHGAYYSAENAQQLEAAFSSILGDILARNSNFVAPVVPVSKLNKVYSGSSLYLGLFFPTESGIWRGNLKKYGLSPSGVVMGRNGAPAVDVSGLIGASVSSLWADVGDGPRVVEGGAGLQMLGQASRNFYTYKTGNANKNLSDANNLFATTNTNITYSLMGVSSDTVKNDLINYLRAEGVYAPSPTGRDWVMGDVIHSIPAVYPIAYDPLNHTGLSLVFVGANDGFLHCFLDTDNANNDNTPPVYSDDQVTEAWSFVPWDLIPRLKKTKSSLKTDSAHEYFVDGSPAVYKLGSDLYLTVGLRRGGTNYYTLKVGDFATSGSFNQTSYQSPSFVWQLGPSVVNLSEPLGQSWGWPQLKKIKTGSGDSSFAYLLLMSGGYDLDEDADKPNSSFAPTNTPAGGDDSGRAVFAVNATNGLIEMGSGSPVFRFSRADGYSAMTHSIVDLVAFDSNNDGFVDTVYAGDLGGNLFVMTDRDANGTWDFRHLFRARGNSDQRGRWLKFFYAPDATQERFETGLGEYVFIGSGDRSNPSDCYTQNRFYAIKNKWLATTSGSLPLVETSLDDVTSYNYGSYSFTNGWFIKLSASEKVVSRPMTFGGMVFFTTYLPDCAASTTTDSCQGSGIGSGRLYILDHQTGKAVFNFDPSNDSDVNNDGVITDEERLGASDRYVSVTGLPTAPVLIMTKSGPQLLIGTTEGILKVDLPSRLSINRYYWKQI